MGWEKLEDQLWGPARIKNTPKAPQKKKLEAQ